ncbi:MAG TPA: toprim domain-containing protein, partial [Candidatus Hydrogenedentes bacterium]|nr:toprim domain-containing protein [Candidatus Hydrogenedentota bacterium]
FQDCIGDVLKGGLGRQYLKTRELKPETVKRFGLGYAPDGGNRFVEAARAKGFKDNVIEASGLARRNERGLFDFFRNRLMIPIRDISGNPVAFGGRDLGDGVPKYINSPENALYKKTRTLYGLFEAREGMRREKRVLLVEGYFDLMRCFDAGIDHVVATCGTALTAEQAALIRRYVPEVVIVYDADLAGIRAALRGVSLLTNAGLTVRAMTLPDGKDPDEYIRKHGPESFRALADAAADFVTFYVRMSENRLDTIEGRTAVARELFVILAGINDELRVNE